MMKLIECVPNISEGRDKEKIDAIASVVETVEGVRLLDVDPGKATNRTVITFVGEPDKVIEAAFRLIRKASELIDMSQHSGEHPRFGATDVCPLVPISNISMEETAEYAHELGARVGKELEIPIYFYENAAKSEERRNLATVRSGEYEGLEKKLQDPNWTPDEGPAKYDKAKTTGATAISARDFLVAYNINLNTTSTRRANAVAFDIREAGRVKKEGNKLTGKTILDEHGEPLRIPGKLKAVKGIGWYIEEYGIAQISYNLTNISITPLHVAFDETEKAATARGLRITGSELVGLVPKKVLVDAGEFFLRKQQRSLGIPERAKIHIAVKSLGLDELKRFNPDEKVIEYMIADKLKGLVDMNLIDFANETASESAAPGGGSIAAYVGALGVSLGTMVANLSAHKRGWDARWEEFSDWAVKGNELKEELLRLVDADTAAFNKIMEAFGLPKNTEDEKTRRAEAIENATKEAIQVPYETMERAYESMEIMKAMVDIGNPNSITDGAVGALCARTAVIGAHLNVKINADGLNDREFKDDILTKAADIRSKSEVLEAEILAMCEGRMG